MQSPKHPTFHWRATALLETAALLLSDATVVAQKTPVDSQVEVDAIAAATKERPLVNLARAGFEPFQPSDIAEEKIGPLVGSSRGAKPNVKTSSSIPAFRSLLTCSMSCFLQSMWASHVSLRGMPSALRRLKLSRCQSVMYWSKSSAKGFAVHVPA